MPSRILAVDDAPETTSALKRFLERKGHIVREENDPMAAYATAAAFKPDIVTLDFRMPKAHGGDVAWQLWSDPRLRETRMIICTAAEEGEIVTRMPPCKYAILPKPIDLEELLRQIETP